VDKVCPLNVILCPLQTDCEIGIVIVALTVTFVLAVAVQLLASVTITVYVPPPYVDALNGAGDATVPLYPFGPLQLYEVPPVAFSEIVPLVQYGPVLLAVAVGRGLTVTTIDDNALSHPV
jgi:hypothetical protein